MTLTRPLVVLVAALFSVPAQAKHTAPHNIDAAAIAPYPFHHPHYSLRQHVSHSAKRHHMGHHSRGVVLANPRPSYGEGVIGGRPAGCPHAYCGCSASLYLFGRIIAELNLAENWFRFPRAPAAPGMAAVRRHHVFIILSVNGDGTVIAHDGNSGHGLTRKHTVSLRGYVVVDPSRGKLALR